MSLILIGGGARSGKSAHALQMARQCGDRLAFVATAVAGDEEMQNRIALHQQERGPNFITFEEPLEVAELIAKEAIHFDALVVDCLTLWLSNLMCAGQTGIEERGRQLV